jgi:periplasmic protein TonB
MSPQRIGFLVSALLHAGLIAALAWLADDSALSAVRPILLISFAQVVTPTTPQTVPKTAATPPSVVPPKPVSPPSAEPPPTPTKTATPKLAPARPKRTPAKSSRYSKPLTPTKTATPKLAPVRPKRTHRQINPEQQTAASKLVSAQPKRIPAKPAQHSTLPAAPAAAEPPSAPAKPVALKSAPARLPAKPARHSKPPPVPAEVQNRVTARKAPVTPPPQPDEERYLATLRQAIEANKRYPRMARRMGIQGRTTVAFVLHRDGRIVDVQVRTGSGDAWLDAAALAAVVEVKRFRPFPEGSTRQTWPISVEVIFSLK